MGRLHEGCVAHVVVSAERGRSITGTPMESDRNLYGIPGHSPARAAQEFLARFG